MLSHDTLRNMFYEACKKINAPENKVYYRTTPSQDGAAHVKIDDDGYHYIVTERGKELNHQTTLDPDELLYWLLSDVVFYMASKYELDNRMPNQDSRRLMFKKEVDLFKKLDQGWAQKKEKEIASILKGYPYVDANS